MLTTHVPATHTDQVVEALAQAGAGTLGDYRGAAFIVRGEGRFTPVAGAQPAIGEVGSAERVVEDRVEMLVPERLRSAAVQALRAAHPYEEPSFFTVAVDISGS